MLDRLRRVTDLFVEGTEAHFGMDEDGQPIVVWVNKLNSFEVEEARQDGLVARGLSLMNLAKDDNPEKLALTTMIEGFTDAALVDALVAQKSDEMYLDVLNDLETDENWAEKMRILRRMPVLLADANAPADDPRRQQLHDLQTEYLEQLRVSTERAAAEAKKKYADSDRADLEKEYFENWRNRTSLDDFMAARRVTELFYAMRDCQATQTSRNDDGTWRWDHTQCNHNTRLLDERSQVKSLPEGVLERITQIIERLTVSPRESGNSAAPQSSSESVEQRNEPEDSTPSTPEETQPAALTT